MAVKRIVVFPQGVSVSLSLSYILWVDVPSANQAYYESSGAISAWPGAASSENAAIAAGQVAEKAGSFAYDRDTPKAELRQHLEERWARFNAKIQNETPLEINGAVWDGINWTIL